ncbi:class F sortase [Streptomyces sp. ST2-7A]|uniref:class F sortase n=1 Tax=Streptomyces sp. ST2-7A TaxID=2907214 RepID=UPI001F43D257|nr:class F sortase [Streptomyces sp. ST2-7A]MCE7080489.1 class F sortase [Streptomyces sp. ST2-7A]
MTGTEPRDHRSAMPVLLGGLVAVTALAILVVLLLPARGAPGDFGSRAEVTRGATPEEHTEPGGGAAGDSASPPTSVGSGGSTGAVSPAPVGIDPIGISLPRTGRDAPLEPVGVNEDGTMEIPEDVSRVGWYRFGPAPGAEKGSAVLAGHVDAAGGERGAMAALYDVRAGDIVTIRREGAEPLRYEVTARELIEKRDLPDELFRRDGPPVLTLITCGGPYDPERGGYASNLVVTAVPIDP